MENRMIFDRGNCHPSIRKGEKKETEQNKNKNKIAHGYCPLH